MMKKFLIIVLFLFLTANNKVSASAIGGSNLTDLQRIITNLNVSASNPYQAVQTFQDYAFATPVAGGGYNLYSPMCFMQCNQTNGQDLLISAMLQKQSNDVYLQQNSSKNVARKRRNVSSNDNNMGNNIFNALMAWYVMKTPSTPVVPTSHDVGLLKNFNMPEPSFVEVKTNTNESLQGQSIPIVFSTLAEDENNNNNYLQVFEKPNIIINPEEPTNGVDVNITVSNLQPREKFSNFSFAKVVRLNSGGTLTENKKAILLTADQTREGSQSVMLEISQTHVDSGKKYRYRTKIDISITNMTINLS
jgi:hypothetical protein